MLILRVVSFNLVPSVSRLLVTYWRDKRPGKRDWVHCAVLFLVLLLLFYKNKKLREN